MSDTTPIEEAGSALDGLVKKAVDAAVDHIPGGEAVQEMVKNAGVENLVGDALKNSGAGDMLENVANMIPKG